MDRVRGGSRFGVVGGERSFAASSPSLLPPSVAMELNASPRWWSALPSSAAASPQPPSSPIELPFKSSRCKRHDRIAEPSAIAARRRGSISSLEGTGGERRGGAGKGGT